MGVYLNSKKPSTLYKNEAAGAYFVDKTSLLEELFPLVEQGSQYICITRPRRFGKTVMANMVSSYFSKGDDTSSLFDDLTIAQAKDYRKHLNDYNVIHITFNEISRNCRSYEEYISRVEKRLLTDLQSAFPSCRIDEEEPVWDVLNNIFETEENIRFIFVMDEWDYIFHRDFVTEQDKKYYVDFLSNLLKNQPYVTLAYMTGILPIAKYSSGSELNMFLEYTMVSEEKYSDYFGFTELEVDDLYARFLAATPKPHISRSGLREWYDGYHTRSGERVYNPRSVVAALINNNLGNYWTSSGPYDEIFYYIQKNVAAVRDDLALMISGVPVSSKIQEYAATSMNLQTKEEIFSAMVVYGFLSYEQGYISVPNRELMERFSDMLRKEPSLGYVHRLARESERMLRATLAGDTHTMVDILEYAHGTEIPLLSYNNESDLTAIVNLVYLSARDSYRVEREDKAGTGYVDFIFYPELDPSADGIILELKINATPKDAIQQIKDRKYAWKFRGRLGENSPYTGRILAVGIAYDKHTKGHSCMIEELQI